MVLYHGVNLKGVNLNMTEKKAIFTNEELQEAFINLSDTFHNNISIETIERIYDVISSYPCFDREKGIYCLGIACDIREEQFSKLGHMLKQGIVDSSEIPSLINTKEYSEETAIRIAVDDVYGYDIKQNKVKKAHM